MSSNLSKNIFNIKSFFDFEKTSLELFDYQYKNCVVYKQYIDYLKVSAKKVNSLFEIPFLPVDFFKSHKIISSLNPVQQIFSSSGTTGQITSQHHVTDIKIYEESFLTGFSYFYGNITEYCVLALLPAYMERTGSSLVYMVEKLIELSENSKSGFYLYNHEDLYFTLLELEAKKQKTILIGVSFGLIDFFEKYKMNLKYTLIMETGGMKGRKKELVRQEMHRFLCEASGVNSIHSEYGMTELLSQAYSNSDGIYKCSPTMKVLIRDPNDPFSYLPQNHTGGVNIIDLANINSCSFIETKDLGKLLPDNSFEILGRFDNSDIRGCNLMVI